MKLVSTTSQTVGPFYSIGFDWLNCADLASASAPGVRLTIRGKIVDGDGKPVPDAVLEIWQADAEGKYPAPDERAGAEHSFTGFGRFPTNDRGEFRFTTIKPGCVPGSEGSVQAPHIIVSIFMRGLLTRLVSRIYFPGEPGNTKDPILGLVPEGRRGTLIAQSTDTPGELEWMVQLQGDDETVFFDC